jgi:hypothetical protein
VVRAASVGCDYLTAAALDVGLPPSKRSATNQQEAGDSDKEKAEGKRSLGRTRQRQGPDGGAARPQGEGLDVPFAGADRDGVRADIGIGVRAVHQEDPRRVDERAAVAVVPSPQLMVTT